MKKKSTFRYFLSSLAVTTEAPFHCTNSNMHLFHLKNDERNICLGLKDGPGYDFVMENIFIRLKCDNRSVLQWFKDPIPQHKTSDGSMRLCHYSGDKCLTAERKYSTGEYHVRVSHYDKNRRSQQWKIKKKTGQLINSEAQLCLTSYSNSKTLPSKKLMYGLETCNYTKKYDVIAQQKWSLVKIPNCQDDMP